MKTTFFFLLTIILLYSSCDDGDILVTDFDFDEIDLDLCQVTTDNFIYFKINTTTREGISFNFSKEAFDEKTIGEFEIAVTANNQFTYRRFNTTIDRDYYCGIIPPSAILVEEEFVSSSGNASISTAITNEDDQDDLEEAINSLDTDEDGIPNYKDQDDDNDNVPTIAELDDDKLPMDTDGDGIPNHLDTDDDGDGIPTRLEDIDGNSDPRNDQKTGDALANYLDPLATDQVTPELEATIVLKSNSVQTEFTTTIIFEDLVLEGLDQTIIDENLRLFGTRTQSAMITDE